ncbi:unnamed protein product (macronuclear) [Paramecium tetraurelia]|uniref:DNA-directed RNA polymerase subunit beta n=1 Tax=Paramecium tetraurelia TaxID=5888 RepID=A0D7M6_PARTE|nr:uncharacterized protein GSPATT00014010001 [Paramecium tetraurelia]CAK79043.1 unnamed protein product [Paramecium tetraurelia]|eukprot:XP_001446440.1 hypothetical protein (macronuclear) [Paramecium tetraurelia strain d4-2]
MISEKDKLITSYLSFRGLQKQHIDSFNYFIEQRLEQIVKSPLNQRITCESDSSFLLEYLSIRVENPTFTSSWDKYSLKSLLYPHECRLNDQTYAGDIYVNVRIHMKGREPIEEKDVLIGRMPIMLGSKKCNLSGKTEAEIFQYGECPYDPKGYFIIEGNEKVILILEQVVDNRIIVDVDNKTDQYVSTVQSYQLETKSKASIILKKNKFYVKSSSFKDAPLFIVFKALGIVNDKEIIELIGTEPSIVEKLLMSFQDSSDEKIKTQLDALQYIGKLITSKFGGQSSNLADQAREKLAQVFLAHVNCKKYDFYPKAIYLGQMVRRLILAMEDKRFVDDKDYYGNKRMRCAGNLLELLFEDLFKGLNSTISSILKKELGKANCKFTPKDVTMKMKEFGVDITKGLNRAIKTGKWTIQRFHMDRQGVTQLLARISYTSALGMLTKMRSQVQKTLKVSGPRALVGSQFGMICPADTPDGEDCGLVKTLALLTHITQEDIQDSVYKIILSMGVEDICHFKPSEFHKNYIVYLNGIIVGMHARPQEFVDQLRILRRRGKINEFVSIHKDDLRKVVNISGDSGRLVRPLILVKDGKPQLIQIDMIDFKQNDAKTVFSSFVKNGKIEYLDVNESDNAFIALTINDVTMETTHLEIDQMTILSCVTGLVPFPHHNQSARNTFQCQMGKQSLGIIGMNTQIRCDTQLYQLIYPQTPLVRTVSMEAVNQHRLPAGHNAQVAVMSYSCYDIEDALIMNKSSLDRGFGRTAVYKKSVTECEINQRNKESRFNERIDEPPTKTHNTKKKFIKKYHALDNDGITKVGAQLHHGDIYVNKKTPQVPDNPQTENIQIADTPSVFKEKWPYTVDRVLIINNTNDGTEKIKTIKTIFRQIRRPEFGDKFSSRHGQKGVVGLIVNQEDMPFNERGWCPDLIMNPHGYPSRMTIAKLMELLCGKLGALEGKFKYGTAFGGENVLQVGEELLKRGFHYQGKDCLISGITGEYMECYVYQGPIFYQRLKHMVIDKIHARAKGPMEKLTRQPVEGRAKDGGQRIGEMERDCFLAYGASNLLIERLLISSDPFNVYVCEICGMFKSDSVCRGCNTDKVYQIRLPYCCKLLFQELLAMNIKPKLQLVPSHERQEYTMN